MMVLQFLLDVWGAAIRAEDVLGRHALHHGAQAGAGESLEYLLSRGAEIDTGASVNGITPLHYAAKVGCMGYHGNYMMTIM